MNLFLKLFAPSEAEKKIRKILRENFFIAEREITRNKDIRRLISCSLLRNNFLSDLKWEFGLNFDALFGPLTINRILRFKKEQERRNKRFNKLAG